MVKNTLTISMKVTKDDHLELYKIEEIANLTGCKTFKSISNITDGSTKIMMAFSSSYDIDTFKEIFGWYKNCRKNHYC